MMNTWFTDIVRNANERMLDDTELDRIQVYYSRLPARLRLAEELERLEPDLVPVVLNKLRNQYPDRPIYTRRFVQDIVESLRHVVQAVLLEDMKILRHRWINHLNRTMLALEIDPIHVRDIYRTTRERLDQSLPPSCREVLAPALDELLDSLVTSKVSD